MAIENTLASTNKSVESKTSKVFNHGNNKRGKLGGMMDSASGIQKNVAGTIGGVGRIVAKAAGALGMSGLANQLTGSSKTKYKKSNESKFVDGNGLKSFYDQFSQSPLNSVDRIDPFYTFECRFQFFPSVVGVTDVTEIQPLTSTVTRTINDVENDNYEESKEKIDKGGVYTGDTGSFETSKWSSTIGKLFQLVKLKNCVPQPITYSGEREAAGQETTGKTFESGGDVDEEGNVIETYSLSSIYHYKQPVTADLVVDLGIYIQKITLPNITVGGGGDVETPMGRFPVPGNVTIPDNNTFSMEVVNVENPVIENIFYPWMRETTLPWWSYESQPFTTANITLDFSQHSNTKYVFIGCRPTQIQLMQPDQSPQQQLTRSITFTFDYMTIENAFEGNNIERIPMEWKKAKLGSGPSNGSSAAGIANSALFSAANTFRL